MRVRSVLMCLAATTAVFGQQPKNVKILTGLSRPEVQRVMNEMRAGLGVHCHYCHVTGQDAAVDGTPQKARAREMMRMVIDLNQHFFGGKNVVTCFTCHNGTPHPKTVPPLPQPLPPDVTASAFAPETKNAPTAAEVLQRYVAAVGRIVPASEPRTTTATRTPVAGNQVAMKVLESGDRSRTDVMLPDGTSMTQVVTGTGGWIRNASGVRELSAEELVAARMGRRPFAPFAETSFGDDAKVRSEKIGDQSVWVVMTASAEYSFAADSGLLMRRVVYYDSPMGRIPEQTDFDRYRSVGDVKVPFTTRVALVDPWLGSTRDAAAIVIGAPITPSQFEKP